MRQTLGAVVPDALCQSSTDHERWVHSGAQAAPRAIVAVLPGCQVLAYMHGDTARVTNQQVLRQQCSASMSFAKSSGSSPPVALRCQPIPLLTTTKR